MSELARQLESSAQFLRDRLDKIEADYLPVWDRHPKITDARREWRAAHTACIREGGKP